MLSEFKKKFNGESKSSRELSQAHWFDIAQRLSEETGETPDPLQIKARAIMEALDLPLGEFSALETNEKGERVNPRADKTIAEMLTNKAGVIIDEEKGITSSDFRDIYPKGLPKKLKNALDPDTRAIMEIEYEHAEHARDRYKNAKDGAKVDRSVYWFCLPGGVSLFIRGYNHSYPWQKAHGEFLQKINQHAKVVVVEGTVGFSPESALHAWWRNPKLQQGHYDTLMHETVKGGFGGLFAEVDARDISKVQMDSTGDFVSPLLPEKFFEKYFEFLKKEHPKLTEKIGTPQNLEGMLKKHSMTREGLFGRGLAVVRGGKKYISYPYLTQDGETSIEPSFLELGQFLFSDALAAIKLLLIAKLMKDGHIEKGPIIDYEGAAHISSKAFFLRYPGYAMEVVLRTINELMAGKVENLPEIYKVFENPNWEEVIREIVRIPFAEVENDPVKSVEIGPNQRELFDHPIDILEIYGINPAEVIPSEEEAKEIIKQFINYKI